MSGKPSSPIISVVIPVKNEAAKIRQCLDGILNQTVEVLEIIVVDSGSTDGTLDILDEYEKVKVIRIDSSEFNHGLTRNLGVQHARGDLVQLTVGDARPADDRWLERMVSHFRDPEVMGVCGQQVVPHEKDKNPHQWFRPQNPPQIKYLYFPDPESFTALTPRQQWEACRWDDVNAIYRRTILSEIPFREVSYGEDMVWAREALSAGNKLVYDQHALVYHYHQVDYSFQYRRTLTVLYHVYKYFGYLRPDSFSSSEVLKLVYRNYKYGASLKWLRYNLVLMFASRKAHRNLRKWLTMGEMILDERHDRVCKVAPQTVKTKVQV